MWEHDQDELNKKNILKIHNMISEKLGFSNVEDLTAQKFEDVTKRCINLLCLSYKVPKLFP